MKIKEGFVLRKMPHVSFVMPTGENIRTFNGALTLNDSASRIYELLAAGKTKQEIAQVLTDEYDITVEQVLEYIEKTCADLIEAGVAE